MKKIAALFTALPLACALIFAQTDTQQTTTTTTQTETRPATTTSSTTRTTTDTHALPTISHWKGTLVDATCAAGAKSTTSSASSTTDQAGSANRSSVTNQSGTTPDQGGITTGTQNPPATTSSSDQNASGQTTTVDTGRHHKGHRSRDASQTESCPVSSSTTMFALKTPDGQVLRFDAVGNTRAAAELKNKPKWTKDLAEGKPIRATVDGMLSGDTVTVTDVH
jgi:hypothetical protein